MLIWTEPAVKDVMEFIAISKPDTENTVKKYFLKLANYIEILDVMPYLGKKFPLFFNNLHIREIIFKSHKIFYQIRGSNIYILAVLHCKMDTRYHFI